MPGVTPVFEPATRRALRTRLLIAPPPAVPAPGSSGVTVEPLAVAAYRPDGAGYGALTEPSSSRVCGVACVAAGRGGVHRGRADLGGVERRFGAVAARRRGFVRGARIFRSRRRRRTVVGRVQVGRGRDRNREARLVDLVNLRGRHVVNFLAAERVDEPLTFVQRQLAQLALVAHDMRRQENDQVVLLLVARFVAEQVAEHRDARDERHALVVDLILAGEQAADYCGAMVLDEHGGRGGADSRRGTERRVLGAVDDVGNFLIQIEFDVVALGNLRHDVERDADVLAVDRVEDLSGQSRVGRRRSDERQILADDDHRFFIVRRQQRRRGEHVGVSVGFKRGHEREIAWDLHGGGGSAGPGAGGRRLRERDRNLTHGVRREPEAKTG